MIIRYIEIRNRIFQIKVIEYGLPNNLQMKILGNLGIGKEYNDGGLDPKRKVNVKLHITIVARPVIAKGNISALYPRSRMIKWPSNLKSMNPNGLDMNPNKNQQ